MNPPFMSFGEGFVRLGSHKMEFPIHCDVSFEGWYIGPSQVRVGSTRIIPWSSQEIEDVKKHNRQVTTFEWLPKFLRIWLKLKRLPLNNYQVIGCFVDIR